MSHDLRLVYPGTDDVVILDEPHQFRGGTYAMGGSPEAEFNITYNYAKHLWRVLGDGGIKAIYGKTAAESIPILSEAAGKLGDDVDPDYWKPTEGNAKRALQACLEIARRAPPDSVWTGD